MSRIDPANIQLFRQFLEYVETHGREAIPLEGEGEVADVGEVEVVGVREGVSGEPSAFAVPVGTRAADEGSARPSVGDDVRGVAVVSHGTQIVSGGVGAMVSFASSETSSSWADEVEAASQASSVELRGAPPLKSEVRGKLRFEAVEDVDEVRSNVLGDRVVSEARVGVSAERVVKVDDLSGTKRYVRTEAYRGMMKALKVAGVEVPKKARYDLALVTFSAAVMPEFFRDGKARLRSYAAVGDAAMTLVAMEDAMLNGMVVESAQNFRSTVLSDASMKSAFVRSAYRDFVSFGSGVDPATSKAGSTALEAIAGVVSMYVGVDAVRKYMKQVDLCIRV